MKLRECLELNKQLKDKNRELHLAKGASGINKKKLEEKAFKEVFFKKADERGAEVPISVIPNLKKYCHESEGTFLQRIEKEVETVIHRSQYEKQFDCKLETKNDMVIVKKNKKMSERKRRKLNKLKEKKAFKYNNTIQEHENSFESKAKSKISLY